ncbi:MAG: SDR family NAD(P)-dependent oxidoreductase [Actinomycetota bacterium]|nr:SDR family NAD(P)-dependent oxidoreductase [Actinomycetota bacterium]
MTDTGRLAGRVAVVTGAASGIGFATACRMAAEGAHVAMVGRREPGIRDAAEGAAGYGTVRPYVADVTNAAAIDRALAAITDELGTPDLLVNNAGVTVVGSITEISEEDWDRQFAVNLKSVFLVSRALWPGFSRLGRASVVNIASVGSVWAIPNDAGYCATKAGVLMLTKCMAVDGAAEGIRVNCVIPGYVETGMIRGYFDAQPDPAAARRQAVGLHPLGRLGTPEDVASACAYLCSDDASWVTGSAFTVDGGVTAGLHGDSPPEPHQSAMGGTR